MKRILLSIALFFICGTIAASEDVSVKIVRYNRGSMSFGSGTVIYCDGTRSVILTNRHVAPNNNAPYEVVYKGEKIKATWMDSYRINDLALLYVEKVLPVAPISMEEPPRGTTIISFGFTGGGPLRRKIGPFLGFREGSDEPGYREIVRVGVSPIPGDSGGGVFTEDGKLVGVIWGTNGAAVPLEDVHAFIESYSKSINQEYNKVYERVMKGEMVVYELKKAYNGYQPGTYVCYLDEDGNPKMEPTTLWRN